MAAASPSETTPLLSSSSSSPSDLHHPPLPHTSSIPDDDTIKPLLPPDEENILADVPAVSLAAVLPSLMIGVFLAAMDNLIVASAYGRIGSDLHELSKTSWIAAAYLVTTTSIQPLYGKLSDIFGRKACLLFAYVVFAAGSGWCGLARSMDELIVGRAVAGVGGGGMTTLVAILMTDVIPLQKRGTWQGIVNIVFALGASTGAPLGGLLADSVGWRWAFLFQVPATLLAALLVAVFLNIPHTHAEAGSTATTWSKFRRVDFLGAATLVSAVLTLLIALDRGGNVSWRDTTVLVTAPLSAALFCAFAFIEARVASDPFAPPRIVLDRGLLSCFLANLFAFGGFFAVMFYIPLYFQAVRGLTASQSGLRMVPAIAGSVTGSLSSGIIMQRTGKYYALTVVAYSLVIVGAVPIVLFTGVLDSGHYTPVAMGLAVMGFGSGIGVTSTLIALIARSGSRDQAVATAVSYLFRSLGSVVGVSVASTLLQGELRGRLRSELEGLVGRGEVDEIVRKVTGSLEYLGELKPEVRRVVVRAYEEAVRYPFMMAAVFGAMAVAASLFIIEEPLRRDKAATPPSESDGDDVQEQ
ncbi:Vacuolar membrane protein [Drechslerella dactyloides]|uniref:Vacuolar membrane protein n=1 Tax=Drechslerella dactyloides TaxID=74499 RepID=A0AAD6IQY5_DREDA|nr:Vacuolar membrane protein [Drechslerella dactyloides]